MVTQSLRSKILVSSLMVVLFLGVSIASLEVYIIKNDIIQMAQNQVKNDLKAARSIYTNEIEYIKNLFTVISDLNSFDAVAGLNKKLGLDYCFLTKAAGTKQK